MADAHFSSALFDFLFDLDVHNDRAWFDANRDRYETHVREPMLAFVRDVEHPLHRRVSRHLVADPRKVGGSMFRIHRDTRFAADKRPYKSNAGAQFRHELGRDVHAPGLYVHLEPGNCFAGAGMWRPDNVVLTRIRERIVEDPAGWKRVRTGLRKTGWDLSREDALKRAPRGFDPHHGLIDDLRLKSFVLVRSFDEDVVADRAFLDTIVGWWSDTRPFLRYLGRTLDLPI